MRSVSRATENHINAAMSFNMDPFIKIQILRSYAVGCGYEGPMVWAQIAEDILRRGELPLRNILACDSPHRLLVEAGRDPTVSFDVQQGQTLRLRLPPFSERTHTHTIQRPQRPKRGHFISMGLKRRANRKRVEGGMIIDGS